MQITFHVCSLF